MSMPQQMPKTIDFPQPAKRETPEEKARRLREQGRGDGPKPERPLEDSPPTTFKKVTTRVQSELYLWVSEQAKNYRERHPRRPRVTNEELMNIALDHLRKAQDLDGIIDEYRS